jgi:hypothetical protein
MSAIRMIFDYAPRFYPNSPETTTVAQLILDRMTQVKLSGPDTTFV